MAAAGPGDPSAVRPLYNHRTDVNTDRPDPYFDARRAESATAVVEASRIVDLLHVTHAETVIARYRDAMQGGSQFPPIAVVRIAGRLVVADGHKRLSAARALGAETITVEVWGIRRLFRDQWRQVRANASKNREIARALFRDPRQAGALFGSTMRHWGRVAMSLATLFRARSGRTPR